MVYLQTPLSAEQAAMFCPEGSNLQLIISAYTRSLQSEHCYGTSAYSMRPREVNYRSLQPTRAFHSPYEPLLALIVGRGNCYLVVCLWRRGTNSFDECAAWRW